MSEGSGTPTILIGVLTMVSEVLKKVEEMEIIYITPKVSIGLNYMPLLAKMNILSLYMSCLAL